MYIWKTAFGYIPDEVKVCELEDHVLYNLIHPYALIFSSFFLIFSFLVVVLQSTA